jgi:hypothetical protein
LFSNGPSIVTTGLDLLVDAADQQSYPGSGTTWRDVVGGQNGTISGSVTYNSAFYGGLVFSGPTASVIFPSTTANFGTSSFTVELAFRPAQINGIHYLVSKNSGSFPSWGIYLSGSGGQGKLFSEFRINASVSCSVSSSTTFVTGSNYQVDVKIAPGLSGSGIVINGAFDAGNAGNGAGSLTSTGSLLIGNIAPSSSQAFSGSIFTSKIYSNTSLVQPVQNFNATATRLSRIPSAVTPSFELLVVAGGGAGGFNAAGGGGAGGLQYFSNFNPSSGTSTVVVGNGGIGRSSFTGFNGSNSSFSNIVSFGGGGGTGFGGTAGSGGSSGGTGNGNTNTGSSILGQGNNGAINFSGGFGGGGGGAGSAGTSTSGGSGSFISSFSVIGGSPAGWFAGGGGGGGGYPGGIGGGGTGGGIYINAPAGTSGSANTGGGGGAGGSVEGNGGSGIVAIRYSGTPIALGGEITQSEGFTYHVYRTVGTSSFTIF